MMEIMAKERNGRVCAMDHRYCIDNGAMIAQAGVLQYQYGELTPMSDATCTQRSAPRLLSPVAVCWTRECWGERRTDDYCPVVLSTGSARTKCT